MSGGERNRVHLAKLLAPAATSSSSTGLPTTSTSRRCGHLEDALVDFAGCAVVISHDRFFLDRICTHVSPSGGDAYVEWFEGTEDYEADKIRRLGARTVGQSGSSIRNLRGETSLSAVMVQAKIPFAEWLLFLVAWRQWQTMDGYDSSKRRMGFRGRRI